MTWRDIPFLAGLDEESGEAVAASMVSLAVPGGRPLFEQGQEGDGLYTLVSGSVGISTRDPSTGAVRRIARLHPRIRSARWPCSRPHRVRPRPRHCETPMSFG